MWNSDPLYWVTLILSSRGSFWAIVGPVSTEVMGLQDLPTSLSMLFLALVIPTTCEFSSLLQGWQSGFWNTYAYLISCSSLPCDWDADCYIQRRVVPGNPTVCWLDVHCLFNLLLDHSFVESTDYQQNEVRRRYTVFSGHWFNAHGTAKGILWKLW